MRVSVKATGAAMSTDIREAVRAGACSHVTATQQFGGTSFRPVLQHSCSEPAVPGNSELMKQSPRTPARGMTTATARLNTRSFDASCLIYRHQTPVPGVGQ